MKSKILLLSLCSMFLLSSCDKFLDIKPTGSVIPETLEEYRALITGAYYEFPRDRGMAGFRSDEMLVDPSSDFDKNSYGDIEIWNDRPTAEGATSFEWVKYYNTIFKANEIINARSAITKGTKEGVDQLVGEAYMLRAYSHFILVNLYGQPYTKEGAPASKSVPLKLDNDLEKVLSRNTVEELYKAIFADIEEAKKLINVESWEAKLGYRFNTKSVNAFDARARLYVGDWQGAFDSSERVLTAQSALEDLNVETPILPNLFTSVEVITALEMTPSAGVAKAAFVGPSLMKMYTAEDMRVKIYYSPAKTVGFMKSEKSGYSKFNSTFRTAEFYLTSAEASAQLGNLDKARTRLLELMRKRYSAQGYAQKEIAVNAMTKIQLIEEILNERARELAFEGHRWYDLRRTTRPEIVKVIKNASDKEETFVLKKDDPRYAILIPKSAIVSNPSLEN